MKNIVKGKFVSVWDNGITVETNCKINLETKEAFDIKLAEVDESFEILNHQYVVFDIDGISYKKEIRHIDDIDEDYFGFWYC